MRILHLISSYPRLTAHSVMTLSKYALQFVFFALVMAIGMIRFLSYLQKSGFRNLIIINFFLASALHR